MLGGRSPSGDGAADRPGRALIVLPTLEGGGAERFNLELAAALQTRGCSCTIFCLNGRGALLAEAAQRGIPVVAGSAYRGTAVFRLWISLLVGLPRLWRLIRSSDATIAGLEGVVTVLAVAMTTCARRPLLAEVQVDLDRKFARTGLIWRILAIASRRCYPRCAQVVAISHGAAASVAAIGADVPVAVVPMGVDVDRLEALAGAEPSPAPVPTVLAVGRLTAQKSFDLLLEAHALARQSAPHRLLILGEGEDREQLERLVAELDVADTVEMPGFTPNPYRAVREASVLCLSSRYEGMPTVLLEALALGCPVIASECSEGVRAALAGGAHGVLVEPGSAAALANAIAAHLANPDVLRAKAEAAAEAVRAAHSYDTIASRYLALMQKAATRKTRWGRLAGANV